MNYHIYGIPGLGFNEAIFSKLNLAPHKFTILNWIEPLVDETIQSYAQRMNRGIQDNQNESIILIGHSFGGVMALEMAKFRKISLVILVSSIKLRDELSYTLKFVDWTKLHYLFNKKIVLYTFPLFKKRHGFETSSKEELFKGMLELNSDNYLKWALKTISSWNGNCEGISIMHIHGDQDLVFDIKNIKAPYYLVPGGNHIMIYDKAEEIRQIILDKLHVLSLQ